MPPPGSADSGDRGGHDRTAELPAQSAGVWMDEPSHGQSAQSPQNGQSGPIMADLDQPHMRSSEAISIACQRRPKSPNSFLFNV